MVVRAGQGFHGTVNQSSAFKIDQSLRFDGSSYLSRTPGSAGNRRTSTFSVWFKWVASGGEGVFLWANGRTKLAIDSGGNDRIQLDDYSGSYNLQKQISQSLRDPSAWYHIVIVFDTTNATAEDRNKLYLNGERITDFETSTNPSQNFDTDWNNNVEHRIGADNNPFYFRGYMAECHMIDGTALDPSYFGFTDPLTNTWRPKKVEDVTYGTNGFYLDFSDSSDIGADRSGNGNDFSTTGLVAADVVPDSPSGVSFGTVPTSDYTASIQQKPSNWATLNPIENYNGRYSNAPTNGNLEVSIPSDSVQKRNFPGFYSTLSIPTTGKFYFEFEPSQQYTTINIVDVDEVNTITSGDHVGASDKLSFQYFCESGNYRFNGTVTASGLGGYTSGNIYGVKVDLGNKTFQVYESGVAGSVLSISTAGGTYAGSEARVAPSIDSSGASGTVKMNFGQLDFVNPPGTIGSTEYFNTVTWTGNGSATSREITGCGFQPDLVWIKGRSVDGSGQRWQDVVRGAGIVLQANNANAEFDDTSNLGAFTSDGFTLTTTGSSYNQSSATYVAWCWKAGGAGISTNTDGDIDSSVSASTDAGFSVFTYTGNGGTDQTVGHGLGAAPSFCIVKSRASNSWFIRHDSLPSNENLNFNSSGTVTPGGGGLIGDLSSTSTITLKSGTNNADNINASGTNYVAYCWVEKSGVSKFGSYTGNGSSDGPVISCGFRPAMVMIKWYADVNTSESWHIYDNKRGVNPNNTVLFPDATADEESPSDRFIQFTEDGFQLKSDGQAINRSGAKFVFMAWAATFTPDNDYKVMAGVNLTKPTSPAAVRPDKYFKTIIYTGASPSDKAVTGVGFAPSFVWIKARTQAYSHALYDTVRGATKELHSDTTDGEDTDTNGLKSFDPDGFTVGSDGEVGDPTGTRVAWCWKAGGAAVSNTDGSITSYVSASPESGVGIVTYTGTGTAGTIGHGLGATPGMTIIKQRNTTRFWFVNHAGISSTQNLYLNGTDNIQSDSVFTSRSSSTIGIGAGEGVNQSGGTYVAYCFAEVEGFSKFGSYTGNNDADGPFVYCGFRPAMIIFKNANDNLAGWHIFDTSRSDAGGANPLDRAVFPNNNNQEEAPSGTSSYVDSLSNGFKIRSATGSVNGSGNTIIFAAFAEAPTNNLYGGQANAR